MDAIWCPSLPACRRACRPLRLAAARRNDGWSLSSVGLVSYVFKKSVCVCVGARPVSPLPLPHACLAFLRCFSFLSVSIFVSPSRSVARAPLLLVFLVFCRVPLLRSSLLLRSSSVPPSCASARNATRCAVQAGSGSRMWLARLSKEVLMSLFLTSFRA